MVITWNATAKYGICLMILFGLFSCKESPVQPADGAGDFLLQVKIDPLYGFEHIVDAVTQASDVVGVVQVRVDSLADTTDRFSEIIVDFGDGTKQDTLTAGMFSPGPGFKEVTHWYVKSGSGRCTTFTIARTEKGDVADTGIVINVIGKNDHP